MRTPAPNGTAAIVAADTETGSLIRPHRPRGRRIWEVALIRRDPDGTEASLEVLVKDFNPRKADPVSLDIGRFHERHPKGDRFTGSLAPGVQYLPERDVAELVWDWTSPGPVEHDGKPVKAHLVAAVPSFEDIGFADLLQRRGYDDVRHHYHLVCVENLAAGRLGWAPPYDSAALSAACGVDRASFGDPHAAMTDTRWALALYSALVPAPALEAAS